jgi:hypothetical protein
MKAHQKALQKAPTKESKSARQKDSQMARHSELQTALQMAPLTALQMGSHSVSELAWKLVLLRVESTVRYSALKKVPMLEYETVID